MPNSPRRGRTNRSVRVDDADWDLLGDVAAAMDVDRGYLVRSLIRWWLQRQPEPPPLDDDLRERLKQLPPDRRARLVARLTDLHEDPRRRAGHREGP